VCKKEELSNYNNWIIFCVLQIYLTRITLPTVKIIPKTPSMTSPVIQPVRLFYSLKLIFTHCFSIVLLAANDKFIEKIMIRRSFFIQYKYLFLPIWAGQYRILTMSTTIFYIFYGPHHWPPWKKIKTRVKLYSISIVGRFSKYTKWDVICLYSYRICINLQSLKVSF